MAGKKGHSGPAGNANAFRHAFSAIQRRRADGELTDDEQDVRDQYPRRTDCRQRRRAADRHRRAHSGRDHQQRRLALGDGQSSHRGSSQKQSEARQNPKALAQLDGYKRPLVGSSSANLQRFGMERIAKVESLQEIIDEMGEHAANGDGDHKDVKSKYLCHSSAWQKRQRRKLKSRRQGVPIGV